MLNPLNPFQKALDPKLNSLNPFKKIEEAQPRIQSESGTNDASGE
jgi:hypothetical protein